jgi:hypothetical protein
MPFALASSANCRFHASKPAAVLPHCAAFASAPRHASTANAAKAAAAVFLPLIMQNSLRAVWSGAPEVRAGLSKRIRPPGVEASPVNRLPSATRTGFGMEEVRGFEDAWEFAGTACFALALSQIDSAHSPACAWRPVALDAQEKTPGHLVVQRNGARDRTSFSRGAAGIHCPSSGDE